MSPRFLAVALFVLAWLAVSVAVAGAWAALRGRAGLAQAGAAALAGLFAAAVLANAGADLW